MTTSGHGTKRMLSRGPALLLAPLLLLCRGNPGPSAATPTLCFCLFGLLSVFVFAFVFNCWCLFYICPPPPVLFRAVSPTPALPPPVPRAALRVELAPSSGSGAHRESPSSSASLPLPARVSPVPTRVAAPGPLREGCPTASAAASALLPTWGGKKEKFGLAGALGDG